MLHIVNKRQYSRNTRLSKEKKTRNHGLLTFCRSFPRDRCNECETSNQANGVTSHEYKNAGHVENLRLT